LRGRCSPTDAEGYCSAKKPDTPCCNYCEWCSAGRRRSASCTLLTDSPPPTQPPPWYVPTAEDRHQCGVCVRAWWRPCTGCPQGVTESFYMEHPEHYATHPAMFLGQVSHDDNEADGCAAQCELLSDDSGGTHSSLDTRYLLSNAAIWATVWPVLLPVPPVPPVLPHGGWAPTRPPCVVCLPACLRARPGHRLPRHDGGAQRHLGAAPHPARAAAHILRRHPRRVWPACQRPLVHLRQYLLQPQVSPPPHTRTQREAGREGAGGERS
jgi:hypothetical protein